MCVKALALFWIVVGLSLAGDIDEACELSNGEEGTCKLVTACQSALNSIAEKRYHYLNRCGFEGKTEVVCCPQTVNKYGGITTSSPATTGARKSETECRRLSNSSPPPLGQYILGGEEAILGEFPHMVALGFLRNNLYSFDCGGTLISETYVLTAAHCIVTVDKIAPTLARMGVVEIGAPRFNPNTDYMIAKTTVHPKYGRPSKYHDMALLRLDTAVPISGIVFPACLYTLDRPPTVALTVTGWGKTSLSQDNKSTVLLKANLTLVPNEQCNLSYTAIGERRLPEGISGDLICAGDREGIRDACQGDSGGPLQGLTDPDGQYRIVGITSFGRGCGNAIPGVYTRVNRYVDWVESVVWPNN